MDDIKGRHILFFCPRFFKYENEITKQLEKMGANVEWFDQRSVQGTIGRSILKIHPRLLAIQSQVYYSKIINNTNKLDYLFVIEGQMIPINIMKKIKKNNPDIKTILYLWDSVSNIKGIKNKFRYFDTIYSYDQLDCKKYKKFIFRPLFYIDEYTNDDKHISHKKYDISSIGTVHSDRYAIIKKIRKYAIENNKKMFEFNYLQKKWVFYFKKILNYEYRSANVNEFSFIKMDSKDIARVSEETVAILDAQHPKNVGLTMRTFEMTAAQKKIITTNSYIVNYNFYNENNIFYFNREEKHIRIPDSFFKTEFIPIDQKVLDEYSIQHWIRDIFDENFDENKFYINKDTD
ncbi:capsular biosynthesis protein CpsH [Dellaglioa algida]|uniref:Eps11J n=1 Tax=Dellaglioa algida DSM 15638 TaxID=1423719 RepID=A0A0R1HGH3_9LACO|nr:hypothetical protein [Dellaglioa algida]KRK45516.1 hypothetical protein FC66_GL001331 [Dellaglioa algida DSM 15638]MDK1732053.1 capsular biosynthesis protein CpsH [Dellaglioa algida]MDK1733579.1 capsular biosynthesis protein CpsH [Dellaglioa algida]